MTIQSKEKNAVLKRQEIVAEVEDKMTPSRDAVQDKLAAEINVPKKQVVISKMDTIFGSNKTVITARAYDSEADMKNVEAKYMQKRNFKEEPKVEAATEAPAAESTEEKTE